MGDQYVRAVWDYNGAEHNPYTFKKDDVFRLVNRTTHEWWEVRDDKNETRFVPATYMKVCAGPPAPKAPTIAPVPVNEPAVPVSSIIIPPVIPTVPFDTESINAGVSGITISPSISPKEATRQRAHSRGSISTPKKTSPMLKKRHTACNLMSVQSSTISLPGDTGGAESSDDDIEPNVVDSHFQKDLQHSECMSGDLIMEGLLSKKNVLDAGAKKSQNRAWIQYYVVLRNMRLYFYPKSYVKKAEVPLESIGSTDITGAEVGIPQDYTKKKDIFSVTTSDKAQVFFQAENLDELNQWYNGLKICVGSSANSAEDGGRVDEVAAGGTMSKKKLKEAQKQEEKAAKERAKQEKENEKKVKEDEKRKKEEVKVRTRAEIKQKKTAKKRMSTSDRYSLSLTADDFIDEDDPEKKTKIQKVLRNFMKSRPSKETLEQQGVLMPTYFGTNLEEILKREGGLKVPSFVTRCIERIYEVGVDTVGIYRLSGNASQIQKLRFAVDQGKNIDFTLPEWDDINIITGALKLFFREMPEPLFPYHMYDDFMSATKISDHNRKMEELKRLLHEMPTGNFETLSYLCEHLCVVSSHGNVNKMLPHNLGIVFGPTLLRPSVETMDSILNMGIQSNLVELCIVHCTWMFDLQPGE